MEQIIYKRLKENLRGTNIYYSKAPADVRLEKNYPMILLSTEKFLDAVHGIAGALTVEIICSQETVPPETFEPQIKKALSGVFFQSERIFLLRWQKSEIFQEPASERLEFIIGMEMTFAIYEFPPLRLADVDVLEGLRYWARDWDENLFIIGLSDFENYYVPTTHKPAVWFSLEGIKLQSQMAAATFTRATIRAHVFAPDIPARIEWLTAMQQALFFIKAVTLPDGSPMRLQDSELDFSATEIQGQLKLVFDYGSPRRFIETHGMTAVIREAKKCTR